MRRAGFTRPAPALAWRGAGWSGAAWRWKPSATTSSCCRWRTHSKHPLMPTTREHSAQSPKFSRAVALVLGNYVTTWVSGTASIVDSETRYPGDPRRQTEADH